MKIKNKLLIFLGIFIFIIIPKNVYAKNSVPYYSKINNTIFSNSSGPTGNRVTGDSPMSLSIEVETWTMRDGSPTFIDYPYVLIYFQSFLAKSDISVQRNATCNSSCFNPNSITLVQTSTSPVSGRNMYVLILPIFKYAPMADDYFDVQDVLVISSKSNKTGYIFVTDIYISDSDFVNSDNSINIDQLISIQNQNTQQLINNMDFDAQYIANNVVNSITSMTESVSNALKSEEAPSNSDVSNKTTEWASKLAGSGPVSQMVLMPITLLNGYVSGLNATCTPYNLGNLMCPDIILPCVNISNYVGVSLWSVIDVLFSGFMIYAIGKKFVKIFNDFTNLRDNQMDELYGGGK